MVYSGDVHHTVFITVMSSSTTSVWLPRVFFESALITVSILLALALDEWRDDRQDEETVEIALSNFVKEIRLNRARVDDAAPFNQGLRDVLSQRHRIGDITSNTEFIEMMESYNPIVLQATAWETALATGSVTKMDYELVSALSLTYGLQGRYLQTTRDGMTDLMRPENLLPEKLPLTVYNSVRYLNDVNAMETELSIVYGEAESVILNAWAEMNEATGDEAIAWGAER